MRFSISPVLLPLLVCTVILDYVHRSTVFADRVNLPELAIVFTGQYDRVYLGLDLLNEGRVQQLFISGVNKRAGFTTSNFAEKFNLNAKQIRSLEMGDIVLAGLARNTLENGVEANCWLRIQPKVEKVVLITSPRHMARASLALDRALFDIKVLRVTSVPRSGTLRLDTWEFGKFIATWFITLLPRSLWPADEAALCPVSESR